MAENEKQLSDTVIARSDEGATWQSHEVSAQPPRTDPGLSPSI